MCGAAKKIRNRREHVTPAHISGCQFLVYCPVDVFDVEKKKSIEQKYAVLMANIIICHQN